MVPWCHYEIYMQRSLNIIDVKSSKKFLRLNKTIYGLKQSGTEWNNKLYSILWIMKKFMCALSLNPILLQNP